MTVFKKVADNAVSTSATDFSSTGVTTVVLASGEGSLMPAVPFWLTLWTGSEGSDPGADLNMEKVVCTAISTDTLTINPTVYTHAGPVNAGALDVAQNITDLQNAVNTLETGSVTGPASATDNAIARYDGTTGKLVQNSGVTIDDFDNLLAKHTRPQINNTYALGTSALYWSNLYARRQYLNSTAYIDGATSGTAVLTGRLSVPSFGSNNQIIGPLAGNSSQTGTYNASLGASTFAALTSGSYNMAIGSGALSSDTTGERNVAVGAFAMDVNTTGSANISIGQDSLGSNVDGGNNVAIGTWAMLSNVSGYRNTGVGQSALESSTGNNNTAIGFEAGKSLATGTDNVFIGYQAGINETGSNKLYISNSSTSTPLIKGDFSATTITTPASIEVTDTAKGIILKSPDGTRFRITVGNDGILTTTSI